MLCAVACHAVRTPVMLRTPPVMPCAHPCHAVRTPVSCCAQSQHPEKPVEPSEPGVAGFRDYARNDKVEDPTLCGEYRDVMPCAHPRHAVRTPVSCCAQSQHPERPVEPSEPGVAGLCDYARNDEVEDPTLCGEYRVVMLRAPPVMPCAHPCHAARSRSIQKGL